MLQFPLLCTVCTGESLRMSQEGPQRGGGEEQPAGLGGSVLETGKLSEYQSVWVYSQGMMNPPLD